MRMGAAMVLLGAACCSSAAHAALSPQVPLAALTALAATGTLELITAGKLDEVKARAAERKLQQQAEAQA